MEAVFDSTKARRVFVTLLAVCMLGGGAVVPPTAHAGPSGDYDTEPLIRWWDDTDPSAPGHQILMSIVVGTGQEQLAGTFELFEGATVPPSGTPIAKVTVAGSGQSDTGDTTVDVTSSSRFSVKFTSGNAAFDSKNFENLRAVCNQGRYSSDGYGPCTLAPAGGFVEFPGQTFWSACAPGRFQPDSGKMSCFLAPPGTYTDSTQATEATLCNMGYFQPDSGAISCLPADVGWFVSAMGSASQTQCPPGLTTTGPAQSACTVSVPTTTTTTTTTLPPLCCAEPTTTTVATTTKRKPSIPIVARTVRVGRTVTIALKKGRNANGLTTIVSTRSKTCKVRKSAGGYVVTGVSRGVCAVTVTIRGNARFSSSTVRRTISVTR